MNEKQRMEILKLCKSIEKKNGEGSIYQLGSSKAKLNIPRKSTMIEDLDAVIGGGIPVGRMIEIYGPESCLCEDTFIRYRINDNINGKIVNKKGGTIKNLYERFHGLSNDGRKNRINTNNNLRYYFTVPSINKNDRIFHNQVADVVKCGIKECYKVTTENGNNLISTMEHKFYVGSGKFKQLKELNINDSVYIHNNTYYKGKKVKKYNENAKHPAILLKYYPRGGVKKVWDGKYIYYKAQVSHLVYEAAMNGYTFKDFVDLLNDVKNKKIIDNLEFIEKGFHIHHKDENILNNDISNLELIYGSEHNSYHALKNQDYMSFIAIPDKIIKIEYIGKRMTYDIKCYAPNNNYIANGIVVHNSGKTSLAFHLASLYDLCLYIPAEGTFDAERARVFGNRPKQLLIYNNTYGEDAMEKAIDFAKAGIPLIIIDSVPFLMPKYDYETVEDNTEKDLRIGGVARLLTKTIPPLTKICERTGTTVIFINQVRDKMDAMLFGEKTSTPGKMFAA